jgi:HK97 family phage major capsid protein
MHKTFTYIATMVVAAMMLVLEPIRRYYEKNLCFYNAPIAPEELKKLEESLIKKAGEVVEQVQKALKDEVEKFQTLTGETNEKITEVSLEAKKAVDAISEFKARMTDVEQKLARKPGGSGDQGEQKTVGQVFVESEEYKGVDPWKCRDIKSVAVGSIHRKTAIINATGQNQPLVPDMRVAGIITAPDRRLTIRDLLPQLRTESNLVQFASENVFTNNAGPQHNSPADKENVAKNESGITFTLSNAAVATIAHWIPASRQILADAPGLAGYIDTRLLYGLKLEEEDQILLGDGSGGNLSGIYTQAATYGRGASNDTKIDTLLKAMLQVALSEYSATGVVLNPIDWTDIMLAKDNDGRYLFANPQDMAAPRIWGLPVVATNSMSAGNFLVGAFALAAAIWDREDATVRVAEQHDDFFTKNMVAILCEERMALTVYRTAAMVKGSLPV